jgi:DNA-binding transcriptional regulator GbsR (MarR family)
MELTTTTQNFILHWGEMGARWGVNRTVAQIHALLYLAPKPLTAEEICAALSLARSTVSTGLHELQSWGIIRVVHVLGDRRDHFETITDVWEMFRIVLNERKRREIDPTIKILGEVITDLEGDDEAEAQTTEKLRQMHDFFSTMVTLYEQVQELPLGAIIRLAKMGDVVSKLRGMS